MDEIFNLINKLEEECNYEEAINHLEIAFEEKLGSFDIRNDMGRIYNKMRKFDEALSCFDIVLAMDDSNQEYLFGKGISLIGLNRFDEALDVFDKLIEVDKNYANGWYYKALLSKSLGDMDSKKYFREFLQLDNENFRKQRSFYKFGIQLEEYEHEFRKLYGLDFLSEFKEELNSLNPNQYTEIVRIVPLDDLFEKVIELKGFKLGSDTEDIIREEFKKQGLSDSDVDDLFKIETVENLKNEVLELCDEDPFIAAESNLNFSPIKLASRYNITSRKTLLNNKDLLLFNRGNFYLDNKEFDEAIEAYEEGLMVNPDNLLLKFAKCCAIYKGSGSNV